MLETVAGDEKPNGYVPCQVKIFALGEIGYFFRFKNRFNECDLTDIGDAENFHEVDKLQSLFGWEFIDKRNITVFTPGKTRAVLAPAIWAIHNVRPLF